MTPKSKLTKRQTDKRVKETPKFRYTARIRYDDQCGNGHNTFSITCDTDEKCGGRWKESSGGCDHGTLAKQFPKLAPFIKWHSCTSDGPSGYIENTIWHITDKDCWGLRKGEYNSFTYEVMVNGKSLFSSKVFYTFRNWLHRDEAKEQADNFLQNIKPELNPQIVQTGNGEPSEGKPSDLEAARNSAIWADATLEQLQDKKLLEARLPQLMADFKNDIESLGFTY